MRKGQGLIGEGFLRLDLRGECGDRGGCFGGELGGCVFLMSGCNLWVDRGMMFVYRSSEDNVLRRR